MIKKIMCLILILAMLPVNLALADDMVIYYPHIRTAGNIKISAYIKNSDVIGKKLTADVYADGGVQTIEIECKNFGWNEIGEFYFNGSAKEYVRINSNDVKVKALRYTESTGKEIITDENNSHAPVLTSLGNTEYGYRPTPTDKDGTFVDIQDIPQQSDIEYMLYKGYIKCDEENLFYPDINITRAELFAIICSVLELDFSQTGTPYKDVKESDWFSGYITAMKNAGILNGLENDEDNILPYESVKKEDINIITSDINTYAAYGNIRFGYNISSKHISRAQAVSFSKSVLDFYKRTQAARLENYKIIPAYTADVNVDVTSNKVMRAGTIEKSSMDRNAYFRIYNFMGLEPESVVPWYKYANVSNARGIVSFADSSLTRDADNSNFVSTQSINSKAQRYKNWFKNGNERFPGAEHIATWVTVPSWVKDADNPWPAANQTAYNTVSDAAVKWLDALNEEGVSMPSYISCWNEPQWPWSFTDLGNYTKTFAEAIHKKYPNMKVGGAGSTFQFPYSGNSQWYRWTNLEKKFFDTAGKSIDYYDFHFYSKGDWSSENAAEDCSPSLYDERDKTAEHYEYGVFNAYLDMVQQYNIAQNQVDIKPVILTEMGRQSIANQFGPWENDFKPWLFMITITNFWMQAMQRADIKMTVPFILQSDGQNPQRGMTLQNNKGLTRFTDYYEFFRDISGDMLPVDIADYADSAARDMLVNSYKKDDEVYVLMHNRKGYSESDGAKVQLSLNLPQGVKVENAQIKRLRWQGEIPKVHTDPKPNGVLRIDTEYIPLTDYSTINMTGEEMCIVKLTLDNASTAENTITETEYYGKSANNLIENSGKIDMTLNLPQNCDLTEPAKLTVGLYRNGGFSKNPEISINNVLLSGYDCTYTNGFKHYFGTVDIPVDPKLLNAGYNKVTIKVSDSDKSTARVTAIKMKHLEKH